MATLKELGRQALIALERAYRRHPGRRRRGLDRQPLVGNHQDGRIYRRGSADMKSGVASHIIAVECLMAAGLKPKGDVYINVVIDEEVSGHGTLDTVIRDYKADAGISGETSDLAVQPHASAVSGSRLRFTAASPRSRTEALRGHQRHRSRQQDRESGRGPRGQASCDRDAPLVSERPRHASCIIGGFSAKYASAFPVNCLLKGSIGTVPGEDHEGVDGASWSRASAGSSAGSLDEAAPAEGAVRGI